MIDDSTVVVASANQVSRNLEGETVILHLDAGIYFGLEGVGGRVWELLQERHTVVEIRDVLLNEYEVDVQRCQDDLRALLEDLAANGLIDINHPQ